MAIKNFRTASITNATGTPGTDALRQARAPSYAGTNTNTTGNTPAFGYGGQDYNKLDAAGRQAMVDDEARLKSDPNYVKSEYTRAQGVFQSRSGANLDTSEQSDYISKLMNLMNNNEGPPAKPTLVTTPQSAPQTQPAPAAASTQPSSEQYIRDMFQGNYDSRFQALKKARETALQQLNQIETGAEQSAYDNRNQADVVNAQGGQRLREAMASSGLLGSGDNLSASAQLAAARQGELGSINRGLSNTLRDVSERRGNINNNSAGDEQALVAETNAARSQALLNDYYHNDDRALKIAELMGYMDNNGQRTQTLGARNSDQNYQLGLGGLTGNINGIRTLPGQQVDWSKDPRNPNNQGQVLQNQGQGITNQINQLKLQNMPQEMKANLDILDQQVKTGAIGLEEAQYKLKEMTDPNSVTNQAKAIDLELSKINLQNAPQEAKLRIQQLQKQIAEIGKAPYRSPEQIDMDKVKLDSAREELKQLQGGTKSTEINTFTDNLRQLYTAKDPYSGEIKVTNSQALRNAIIAKGLPDDKTDELLLMFGLPTN